MFGLISKKKVANRMRELKKENNMQEFKKSHPDTAQYWQGYEDGNDNVYNYIIDVICK